MDLLFAKEESNTEREEKYIEMRDCELCGKIARIYCESDEARLCWDCDEKVHGANFLVAKHLRSLFCLVCQSPTPWKASGRRLTPTVSVCVNCTECHGNKGESLVGGNDEVREEEDDDNHEADIFDSDDDEIEEDEDSNEDDEDGENQVVPWSCSPPPPPAAASSSSSEEDEFLTSKRMRENADLDSDVCFMFCVNSVFFFLFLTKHVIYFTEDGVIVVLTGRNWILVSDQGRSDVV